MTFSAIKDPQSVLDYAVDWSTWLASGDTITSSSWSVSGPDSALVIDTDTNDTTSATVWLSAGTLSKTYSVVNRVVTDQGRTDDRTIRITVMSK